MWRRRIPVAIDPVVVDGEGRVVPQITFQTALVDSPNAVPVAWKQELERFSQRYRQFVQRCRGILAVQEAWRQATGRASPLVYWALGEEIARFVDQEAKGPFRVAGLFRHLARDLDLSSKTIQRVIRLRRLYTEASSLPDNELWSWLRDATTKAVTG